MKITINVTKRDIKLGEPVDGWHCPIARAVKRTTKGEDVFVSKSRLEFNDKAYFSPDFLRSWINKYDGGERVRPFRKTFILKDLKDV